MSPRPWWGTAVCSLGLVAVLAQPALAGSGKTFGTPEAAVEHFVKSIAADDLDGALQAFAVDELVARAELIASETAKRRERSGVRVSKSRTFLRMFAIKLTAECASETRRFVYALLLDNDRADWLTEATDANIDSFIRAADPARLKSLQTVRIDQPVPSVTRTASALENAKAHASAEGADDSTERIALFRLDGKHYRGVFGLLRYGGSWRIRRLSSFHDGDGPHDPPVRATTPEKYQELTK